MNETVVEPIYRTITTCRGCGYGTLWSFLDLGNMVLPRFPLNPTEVLPRAPLELVKCEHCHLVQLRHSVDRDMLFKRFWYRSGISQSIRMDLEGIAKQGMREARFDVANDPVVVDIGSNDGTLLSYISGAMRVGFEPAGNLAEIALKQFSGHVVEDYFSADGYQGIGLYRRANLVTAVAMFYDLEDPVSFLKDVASILDSDGVFICQQNYLGLMLQNTAYDNVCHEHLMYYCLSSMEPLLEAAGLETYRVELNQVNGGSFRSFIGHRGKHPVTESVRFMKQMEMEGGLDGRKVYRDFSHAVHVQAFKLRSFVMGAYRNGKRTMIYGAGTRGATIFAFALKDQYEMVPLAIDNNPDKSGRYYLDSGIAIVGRHTILDDRVGPLPDYLLVLPYHVAGEIARREESYLEQGGKLIVPLPELRIIEGPKAAGR